MTIEIGKPTVCYGVFIDLQTSQEEIVKSLMSANAERAVEIAVKYKGETKEFTFADFLTRLGFFEKREGQDGN